MEAIPNLLKSSPIDWPGGNTKYGGNRNRNDGGNDLVDNGTGAGKSTGNAQYPALPIILGTAAFITGRRISDAIQKHWQHST